MRVARVDAGDTRAPDEPAYFNGPVRFQDLHRTKRSGGIELVAVFFQPGVRTRPHIHATDQLLQVMSGEGVVATERERRLVRAGDIVVIEAGQWHWHGATPSSAMCHVAARPVGPTDWAAPLRDWDTYMEGAR